MTDRRSPIEWMKTHPGAVDAVVAVMIAGLSLPAMWSDPLDSASGYRPASVTGALLLVLGTLPVAWRRRSPLRVLAVVAVAVMTYEVAGFSSTLPLGLLVALYTVAAYCDRRHSRLAGALVGAALVVVLPQARWEPSALQVVANLAIFAMAWLVGDNVQVNRTRVADLAERAGRAERERQAEALRAAGEERSRIARELHDIIAHSLSVMIVQAGGARRVLSREPGQAAEALASIESTGRQAMTEMRRLLGVLRDDRHDHQVSFAPQPSLSSLPALVEHCAAAGLRVSIEVTGAERGLPPGVDLSAFRIVQEALTNVLRHAGTATATVRVAYGDRGVELEIHDDGNGKAVEAAGEGNGHGLAGMRERVQLFGGDLVAGPQPGGGFRVTARLPLEPVWR